MLTETSTAAFSVDRIPAGSRQNTLGLIDRARHGNADALDELLDVHRSQIERICRRLCRSDDGFEDVLQETYLAIVRNLGSFRGDAAFATWVYTIARTFRGRHLRTRARRLRREDWLDPGKMPAADTDCEREFAGRQLGASILAALDQLSSVDRAILIMRDLEGRSAAEVARETALTVPAVKTRLHRARTATRTRLQRARTEYTA